MGPSHVNDAGRLPRERISTGDLLSCSLTGLTVLAALDLARVPVLAQPVVPPGAVQQFKSVVGDRVEAVSILATFTPLTDAWCLISWARPGRSAGSDWAFPASGGVVWEAGRRERTYACNSE